MPKKLTATKLNEMAEYATQEEIEAVRSIGCSLDSSNIAVMIGAGPGVLALALLEDHPDPPHFLTIDNKTCQWVDAHLKGAGVNMKAVDYIVDDSYAAGLVWIGKNIDFLIIDGDHSYEGVARDLEAWLPHVVDGGSVLMHDYLERDGGFSGEGEWLLSPVSLACDEYFAAEWEKVTSVGISVIYRRAQ